MHSHACPRQVLGIRMGILAGKLLDIPVPQIDKRLLTITETEAPRVPLSGDLAPAFVSYAPSARTAARIIDESSSTLNTSGQMSSQALHVMQSGSIQTFAMTAI